MEYVDKNEFRTISVADGFYGTNIQVTLGDNWEFKDKTEFHNQLTPIIKSYLYSTFDQQTFSRMLSSIDMFLLRKEANREIYCRPPIISMDIESAKSFEDDSLQKRYNEARAEYIQTASEFGIRYEHDRIFVANKLAKLYKKYGFWDVRMSYTETKNLFDKLAKYGYGKDYTEELYNPVTGRTIHIGFKHDYFGD